MFPTSYRKKPNYVVFKNCKRVQFQTELVWNYTPNPSDSYYQPEYYDPYTVYKGNFVRMNYTDINNPSINCAYKMCDNCSRFVYVFSAQNWSCTHTKLYRRNLKLTVYSCNSKRFYYGKKIDMCSCKLYTNRFTDCSL